MFQGGLDTSAKMVMTLQKFCEHVNETSWIMWTYVQDELFLPMRQFLRQDVGTSVRQFFLQRDAVAKRGRCYSISISPSVRRAPVPYVHC